MQTIKAFKRSNLLTGSRILPPSIHECIDQILKALKTSSKNVVFVVDSLKSHEMKAAEQQQR
jgi:hypothetical protein